jgi:hypothetical protein
MLHLCFAGGSIEACRSGGAVAATNVLRPPASSTRNPPPKEQMGGVSECRTAIVPLVFLGPWESRLAPGQVVAESGSGPERVRTVRSDVG